MVGWNLNPLTPNSSISFRASRTPSFALMRVDADERDQHVGILRGQLKHFVIVVAAKSGLALGIDRKDHRSDLPGAVIGRSLRHSRWVLVGALEILGHLSLEIVLAVVAMHAAGLFGVGVDVDRHGVVEIGQPLLLHLGSPARELKIDYII